MGRENDDGYMVTLYTHRGFQALLIVQITTFVKQKLVGYLIPKSSL